MRLVIATSNPHKVDEIRNIIGSDTLELVGLDSYQDVQMPEEDGTTFLENARIKAVSVANQTGEISLADDSGICVDALGGGPGIHSNRFIGDDTTPKERNEALLRMLGRRPDEERTARFVCAACIAFPDGQTFETLEVCEGVITRRPVGSGGFGYDPVFFIPDLGKTLAEVSQDEKNQISHRGKAMRVIVSKLKDHIAS